MWDDLLDFEKITLIDSTLDELFDLWLEEGDAEHLLQLKQVLTRQLAICNWAIDEIKKGG